MFLEKRVRACRHHEGGRDGEREFKECQKKRERWGRMREHRAWRKREREGDDEERERSGSMSPEKRVMTGGQTDREKEREREQF